nr:unknown [Cytobacillus firmus]
MLKYYKGGIYMVIGLFVLSIVMLIVSFIAQSFTLLSIMISFLLFTSAVVLAMFRYFRKGKMQLVIIKLFLVLTGAFL